MTLAAAPDAAIERAIALQRGGRPTDAEREYRNALARGDHPVAQHNLAILLAQRGEIGAALPLFAAALAGARDNEMYWLSCARGYLAAGEATAALALLEGAAAAGFASAALGGLTARAQAAQLDARGTALAAAGRLDEAVAAFEAAVARNPGHAEAHFHLGSLLSERGEIAQGFAHFMRRAALIRRPTVASEAVHKVKHDTEQRDWLVEHGIDGKGLVFADGARVEGSAIDPAHDAASALSAWRRATPQFVVIDNFLTAAALARLQNYCAGSTIWHRVYDAGYIGATPEDGLACPLLAQIAEGCPARFPAIFGGHGFRYLGAFKYDSALSTGTNTHADNAAINVNFYITPDTANLDPASGGMEIWNVAAPDAATMRRLNSDEEAVRAFLADAGATSTIIPHRENRAVIFRSNLFHRTDRCRFAEGYRNKRINVSLLYGQLGAAHNHGIPT